MTVVTAQPEPAVPPVDQVPGQATTEAEEFWVEPGTSAAPVPTAEAHDPAPADEAHDAQTQHAETQDAEAQDAEAQDAEAQSGAETQDDAEAQGDTEAQGDVHPDIAQDAGDFGAYVRAGGWAFALKVARSVRPGGELAGETPKVSAKGFAALAGCSPERVMRYYKAWDKAADDGLVPYFEALTPGQDVELPDSDVWHSYYTSRSSAASERGTAIAAAAEAEGIRPTKALEVAENPTALRAAILADPSTAQAARTALLDRLQEDPALQTELARDIARTDDLKKAVASETQAASRIGYVRQIVENGQVKTPAGQTIDAPAELRAEAERHLSLIDELDEGEETSEWASEAYDSVKDLVAQTIQANPELRLQERRTKFYSSLQKATKVFEELTFDDVDDLDTIYEDDMLQRLEELQDAITTCITALRKAAPGE
ncbi:hypothetical protein KUF83_18585 [Streptomyces sp. BV286]|uniref:hypothetical protein n=1 Tax=Streptomyces sp. BV286 TaxID=2849672 RepID=UPI001C2E602B|nr:hypothetical protein [Streptomyces sp. BV286]MBV1938557.1 hypothetical protein [Streptomyces sp. BV286]